MDNSQKNNHISIIGSCVSRDVFEIARQADGYVTGEENEYVTDRFVQSITPISAIAKPVEQDYAQNLINESLNSQTNNFYKRNFRLDITKLWFDYLAEVKSEWLIIDMSIARFMVKKAGDTYTSHPLLFEVQSKYKDNCKESAIKKLSDSQTIDPSSFSEDELRRAYYKYYDTLLKLYPEEKIIVLDVRHTFTYIDKVKETITSPDYSTYQRYQHENKLIDFAYTCAKEKLRRAHFVDMLPTLVGNANHKWGKHGLHYVDDIYLYFYRCVDYIIHSGESESQKQLQKYKEYFSKKIFDYYSVIANESVQRERNLLKVENGPACGIYEKNGITLTVEKNGSFRIFGTPSEDTALYLYSGEKNPCGNWSSIKTELPAGNYVFSTKTEARKEKFYIQMILTEEESKNQRWINGNLSTPFKIERKCDHILIRAIIHAGVPTDLQGTLVLEKL